jgi:hypothetical protein
LNTGETEIADLEIAVLIDEDVGRLKITMDDTCRVDILKSTLETVSFDALLVGGNLQESGRGSIG